MIFWDTILQKEFEQSYFKELSKKLFQEAKQYTIYPPKDQIFNAFKLCPWYKIKCLILGQDPYHTVGKAHGLSFSVPQGVSIPPSLQNIFKELKSDLGIDPPQSGDLSKWAKQGVLLINNTLTVRKGEPNSHLEFGWSEFTNNIIRLLNEEKKHLVFILLGKFAQSKKEHITNTSHLTLCFPHPSPYSASSGFFGSKIFSKTNEFLRKTGQAPIQWHLVEDEDRSTIPYQDLEKAGSNDDNNYFADTNFIF